jgi:hypothetical protein
VEVSIEVPPDATHAEIGIRMVGGGVAWVDDVDVAFEPVSREPFPLRGFVFDTAGRTVAGARVVATDDERAWSASDARTSEDGSFSVPVAVGAYTLSAVRGDLASVMQQGEYGPKSPPVSLLLERPASPRSGRVEGGPLPDDARLIVACSTQDGFASFVADVGRDGAFTAVLPEGLCYARVVAAALASQTLSLEKDASPALRVARYAAPPANLTAWVKARAAPVRTYPEAALDDLRPLAPLLAGARVVGLGATAFGSRELIELKHRIVRYLVTKQHVATILIDMGWGQAIGLDEYLQTGRAEAVRDLGATTWRWRTVEAVAMLRWLRAWNSDPRHHKVHVYGVEQDGTAYVVKPLLAFLDRVDPSASAAVAPSLTYLIHPSRGPELAKATAAVTGLVETFERNRQAWSARAGTDAWCTAREHARHFLRVATVAADLSAFDRERDATIQRLVELDPNPLALLGSDMGVGVDDPRGTGAMLRRILGDKYRPIALVFHRGTVFDGNQESVLDAAPVGDLGEAFSRIGVDAFGLDLRGHRGPAAWLDADRPYRRAPEGSRPYDSVMSLGRGFDGVFLVERSTAATAMVP